MESRRPHFRQQGPGGSSKSLAVAVVILLCACSIGVFAFGDGPVAQADGPVGGEGVIPVPKLDPEAMAAARVQKEAELAVAEEETEEELATPAAEAERELSEHAYTQVDAKEAFDLLEESFAPSLEGLNEDPGRVLTDAEVQKVLSPVAARIWTPEGGPEILEGSIPLTSALGGEGSEPIDLSLEPSGEGFAPANPLTPTDLPGSAEERIGLAGGVQVELPASADREAVQVGQAMLFYPETETDTDTLVAPVADGTEVFEQLRSAESPEELRFGLHLPAGAVLEGTEGGGAVVTDAYGKVLETVPTPAAVDAQGATVPTTMTVEGNSLVVSVALRESEVAYPVLVDPSYLVEPANFYEWQPSEYTGGGEVYGLQQGASFLRAWSFGSNAYYAPSSWGQYGDSVPGPTAYIAAASFYGMSFYPMCSNGQPHGFVGLWNPNYGRWDWLQTVSTYGYNFEWNTNWAGVPGTQWAVFGIGAGAAVSQLPCVHEFWMGSYGLAEKDETPPAVDWVEGVPVNRWINGAELGNTTVRVIDTGFGVSRITVASRGAGSTTVRPNAACTGVSGHRCPSNVEVPWTTPGPWGEGRRKAEISVEDPMGNVAEFSPGYTEVDVKEPEIELHGQFARATKEVGKSGEGAKNPAGKNRLSLPAYELQINATDGSNAEEATMQSGVATVELKLDGTRQPLPWGTQTCAATANSCPLSGPFTLNLVGLTAGVHRLEVIATDRVGHPAERKIEFEWIPATGEGENQVLEHFPLSAGKGEEGEQPEVAVNVMNGNLVFHQRDGELATADAGGAIERVYNSQLPAAQSGDFGTGWTMADTPELEPGAGGAGAGKGILVQGDGTVETAIPLPTESGKHTFNAATQATIEKVGSGYTVTDEGGEAEPPADLTKTGVPTALQGSGEASLDLSREAGKLTGLSVDDPGTASGAAEQAVTENGLGFLLSAGATGSLSQPVAVATDTAGDVYVADAGNHRVQEFDPAGAFIRQWGTTGTGQEQFGQMVGIAVGGGNVYVAEPTRVQEFTATGTFIRQIGAEGTANGQFLNLAAIAIDGSGNLFALDMPSTAYRVQKLTSTGTYVSSFAIAKGVGASALSEPKGMALDKEGHVWVADTGNSRLREMTAVGSTMATIGTIGTGLGRVSHPRGVTVDGAGHVWIADTGNSRVLELSSGGTYLARFGEPGTGVGKLSEPSGVALDPSGNLWVASPGNNRVERWTPSEPLTPAPVTPAPRATVETSGGLVSSIKGAATGSITYSHEGTFLSAVASPEGTTKYGKDSAGRLNKIELPNKSKVEVVYDSVGRVTELKVSLEGAAVKTTSFQYLAETSTAARETVTHRPAVPATHYAIDEFGDVLKWWNALKPPTLQELDGTLYTERIEKAEKAAVGDKELRVEARSPEGIEKLLIVANGNQVVAEKLCEEPHPWECTSLPKIYETETGNWPPGLVSFEVIAIEANELGSASTHFSINMPETPPPNPSGIEQPTFERVQRFREEFGLDLDLKGNERAQVERINNLIAAWDSPGSPEGAVARASAEKWGVPLRKVDVEEMEYRERYLAQDEEAIEAWGFENAPGAYAGWTVESAAGGIVRVGFTSEQASRVAAMKSYFESHGLLAANRIQPATTTPTNSLVSLEQMASQLMTTGSGHGTIQRIAVNEKASRIDVDAANAASAEAYVAQRLGAGAPVRVTGGTTWGPQSGKVTASEVRQAVKGPLYGGAYIGTSNGQTVKSCTVGVGAKEPKEEKIRGVETYRYFVLTAGHCGRGATKWGQIRNEHEGPLNPFGTLRRNSLPYETRGFSTDVAAIEITNDAAVPREILPTSGSAFQQVRGAAPLTKGVPLCMSAGHSGRVLPASAGRSVSTGAEVFAFEGEHAGLNPGESRWAYEQTVYLPEASITGDSGSPVYQCATGLVIGLDSYGDAGEAGHSGVIGVAPLLPPTEPDEYHRPAAYKVFTPDQAPGILGANHIGHLILTKAGG
jgi:sugar lactone lactonase YvrE